MRQRGKWGTRHAWVAALDTVLLIVYMALQEPGGATGFVLHEWIGLGFIPLFVIHVVVSWSWITTTWGRVWNDPAPRARINFLLNAALFVMMLVVVISGLVISEYALPAAGVHTRGTQRWEQLHNFTSSLITPVIALHLALNWSWITRAVRRYLAPSSQRGLPEREDTA
jgi:Domain of unknown function (DUF4405)